MAAISRENLTYMTSRINNNSGECKTIIEAGAKNMLDTFNNNWITPSAQELATEIQTSLQDLNEAMLNFFSVLEGKINSVIKLHNQVENDNINYQNIEFQKTIINLTLNSTLPNGKVGVMENVDLSTINKPLDNLKNNLIDELHQLVNTINSIDVFNSHEQNQLEQGINSLINKLNSEMIDLENSLKTRLQQEISLRAQMKKINESNLSA